jgi:transcriptional regulator with XRE-family HTH domain
MISISEHITRLRKDKKWSQDDLAKEIGSSRVMIGKYERGDNMPSIEVIVKLAKSFDVSIDYLVGNTDLVMDSKIVNRIQNIQQLDSHNKEHLFALMDAFLRDFKTKQAYAS